MHTLGALEELIMLLVLREGKTYGAELVEIYHDQLKKEITLPAVVMVLKRLEKKGFLKSVMGEPTSQRGGRRKRIYEATELGHRIAEETMQAKSEIWKMIPKLS